MFDSIFVMGAEDILPVSTSVTSTSIPVGMEVSFPWSHTEIAVSSSVVISPELGVVNDEMGARDFMPE